MPVLDGEQRVSIYVRYGSDSLLKPVSFSGCSRTPVRALDLPHRNRINFIAISVRRLNRKSVVNESFVH
jgi:hypothetical protein